MQKLWSFLSMGGLNWQLVWESSLKCQECYSSGFHLKEMEYEPLYLMKVQCSRHTPLEEAQCNGHSETNRYNSCKPHLNIIAFSGKREHHLIETWTPAQRGQCDPDGLFLASSFSCGQQINLGQQNLPTMEEI